jgi:predicted SAM-dependent methyltransferase
MIEHVPYSDGLFMLKECYRILKKNGKLRISTPDLAFLINLYSPQKSQLQQQYIEWSMRKYMLDAPYSDDTFVINNFVRAWGHSFIYDEKSLRAAMEHAGFSEIVKFNINDSNDVALRNLEYDDRMPLGFLQLETVTLEGTKKL